MVLVCVKKGYRPIDANVSESLALNAIMNSDEDGGRAISMVTATAPALAVAA